MTHNVLHQSLISKYFYTHTFHSTLSRILCLKCNRFFFSSSEIQNSPYLWPCSSICLKCSLYHRYQPQSLLLGWLYLLLIFQSECHSLGLLSVTQVSVTSSHRTCYHFLTALTTTALYLQYNSLTETFNCFCTDQQETWGHKMCSCCVHGYISSDWSKNVIRSTTFSNVLNKLQTKLCWFLPACYKMTHYTLQNNQSNSIWFRKELKLSKH